MIPLDPQIARNVRNFLREKERLERDARDAILREQAAIQGAQRNKRKFFSYFPDEGPLRRELYTKHVQFMNAGAKYRERAMIAGNRCLTMRSQVETDRGERLAHELIGETGFYVRSWDGSSRRTKQSSPLFLKSIEPAFQIHLDNGEVFECSGRHRVFLPASTDERLPSGWASVGHLIRASSGLHFCRTAQGWKASYASGDRLCDESPLDAQESFQHTPPTRFDAPNTPQHDSITDVAASKPEHTRACQSFGPLPTQGEQNRLADLFARMSNQDASQLFQPTTLRTQLSRLSLYASNHSIEALQSEAERLLASHPQVSSFLLAFESPVLFPDRTIVAILPLGYQPIIDFEVRDLHNYFGAGVLHHNSGKSEMGAYETTAHLTGLYPKWWTGKRFSHPIEAWAVGDKQSTVRDILQSKLLGLMNRSLDSLDAVTGIGTGMIPGSRIIGKPRMKMGIPDAVESVYVRHASGGTSILQFKSYEQGRVAFQGTAKQLIWLDEECPEDIYTECLVRTMTTDGILILTFTPLAGLSPIVLQFLPGGKVPDEGSIRVSDTKFVVSATWDDAPHLSEQAKAELIESFPPFQRDARTKGVPQLGSGAIYPVPESEIVVPDFEIPATWPRCYGMDVGWNRTAALWATQDPNSKVWYLYSEHYVGREEPALQAQAIRARGAIPGVIDPAARGRGQKDGEQLFDTYQQLGLDIEKANNAVEAGLYSVWQAFTTGQLKVFNSLKNFLEEFRVYRRDDRGHVVKEKDHCFVAGTMLATPSGPTPVEQINGPVFGRSGSISLPIKAWKTGIQQPVISLSFSDGSVVTCTRDDRFMTIDGWRIAEAMLGRSCLIYVSQRILVCEWISNSLRSSLQRSRSFLENVIICAANTFNAMVSASTSLFGHTPMAEHLCLNTTFTTPTGTAPTMTRPISKNSTMQSTFPTTIRESIKHYRHWLYSALRNGTPRQPDALGINCIAPNTARTCAAENSLSAHTAVRRSTGSQNAGISSAPITASRHFAVYLALTTRNVFAWLAQLALQSIATLSSRCAPEHAAITCVGIKDSGLADVYSLHVPGTNAFCLENGILVHNCMDSLRYLWQSGRARAKPIQAPILISTTKKQFFHTGDNSQSWMAN